MPLVDLNRRVNTLDNLFVTHSTNQGGALWSKTWESNIHVIISTKSATQTKSIDIVLKRGQNAIAINRRKIDIAMKKGIPDLVTLIKSIDIVLKRGQSAIAINRRKIDFIVKFKSL